MKENGDLANDNSGMDEIIEEFKSYIIKPSHYRMIRQIGKGGYAEVWLAQNKSTGEEVAYKQLFTTLQPKQIMHFAREVKTMASVDHPFFLKFLGFSPSPPLVLVTEYIQNGSLFVFMRSETRRKRLTNTHRTLIAMGIAHAMSSLHSIGIIHRDLKSLNVLLDKNLLPRLGDFGIARYLNENDMPMTMRLGTPHWMAPETLYGNGYGPEVDVYSFAMLLYELLTNSIPWEGRDPASVIKAVALDGERPEIPENTPEPLKKLITQCWDKEPGNRPSFSDIYERFEKGEVEFEGTEVDAVVWLSNNIDEYIRKKKEKKKKSKKDKNRSKSPKNHNYHKEKIEDDDDDENTKNDNNNDKKKKHRKKNNSLELNKQIEEDAEKEEDIKLNKNKNKKRKNSSSDENDDVTEKKTKKKRIKYHKKKEEEEEEEEEIEMTPKRKKKKEKINYDVIDESEEDEIERNINIRTDRKKKTPDNTSKRKKTENNIADNNSSSEEEIIISKQRRKTTNNIDKLYVEENKDFYNKQQKKKKNHKNQIIPSYDNEDDKNNKDDNNDNSDDDGYLVNIKKKEKRNQFFDSRKKSVDSIRSINNTSKKNKVTVASPTRMKEDPRSYENQRISDSDSANIYASNKDDDAYTEDGYKEDKSKIPINNRSKKRISPPVLPSKNTDNNNKKKKLKTDHNDIDDSNFDSSDEIPNNKNKQNFDSSSFSEEEEEVYKNESIKLAQRKKKESKADNNNEVRPLTPKFTVSIDSSTETNNSIEKNKKVYTDEIDSEKFGEFSIPRPPKKHNEDDPIGLSSSPYSSRKLLDNNIRNVYNSSSSNSNFIGNDKRKTNIPKPQNRNFTPQRPLPAIPPPNNSNNYGYNNFAIKRANSDFNVKKQRVNNSKTNNNMLVNNYKNQKNYDDESKHNNNKNNYEKLRNSTNNINNIKKKSINDEKIEPKIFNEEKLDDKRFQPLLFNSLNPNFRRDFISIIKADFMQSSTSNQYIHSFFEAISSQFSPQTSDDNFKFILHHISKLLLNSQSSSTAFVELGLHHRLPSSNPNLVDDCFDVLYALFQSVPSLLQENFENSMKTYITLSPQKSIVLLANFAAKLQLIANPWPLLDLMIRESQIFLKRSCGALLVSTLFYICNTFEEFKKERLVDSVLIFLAGLQSKYIKTIQVCYNALCVYYDSHEEVDFEAIVCHLEDQRLIDNTLNFLLRLKTIPIYENLICTLLKIARNNEKATLVLIIIVSQKKKKRNKSNTLTSSKRSITENNDSKDEIIEGAMVLLRDISWISEPLPTIEKTLQLFLCIILRFPELLNNIMSSNSNNYINNFENDSFGINLYKNIISLFSQICDESNPILLRGIASLIQVLFGSHFNFSSSDNKSDPIKKRGGEVFLSLMKSTKTLEKILDLSLKIDDDISIKAALVILGTFGEIDFAREYLLFAEKLKKLLVVQSDNAGAAVSVISMLSKYALCAQKFKDLNLKSYFSGLLKDEHYREPAMFFLKNIDKLTQYF